MRMATEGEQQELITHWRCEVASFCAIVAYCPVDEQELRCLQGLTDCRVARWDYSGPFDAGTEESHTLQLFHCVAFGVQRSETYVSM